jgi:Mg/Co/Ni transporter MgtE
MEWMRRVFNLPATETQTGIVLGFCIFAMSVMSIVLVWQAQVIARQNAVIHMFQSRLGG